MAFESPQKSSSVSFVCPPLCVAVSGAPIIGAVLIGTFIITCFHTVAPHSVTLHAAHAAAAPDFLSRQSLLLSSTTPSPSTCDTTCYTPHATPPPPVPCGGAHQSAANRFKRHIVPVLSVSVDFYIRVFVRVFT
ncbi:unnamed protein product [Closterium sp. NIES-53]